MELPSFFESLKGEYEQPRTTPVELLEQEVEAIEFLVRIVRRQVNVMDTHWRVVGEAHIQTLRRLLAQASRQES
jgi:hypothetical protein